MIAGLRDGPAVVIHLVLIDMEVQPLGQAVPAARRPRTYVPRMPRALGICVRLAGGTQECRI